MEFLFSEIAGVVILGVLAGAKVLGEALILIGKADDKVDWKDNVGASLLVWAGRLGKFLAWIGVGNSSVKKK